MKKARELYLLETLEGPWQEISINIIRLLPKLKDKDAIVIIVNWFTKMIKLKVTTTTVLSENIAKIYWDNIWKLHGVPWKVLSDRRSQFTSKFIEDLIKILETKKSIIYSVLSSN